MTHVTVELQRADLNHMEALAKLIVQLYNVEVPGVLGGPYEGQIRLFQHILTHELKNGGYGRYVAQSESGTIIGSIGLRLAGEPISNIVPPELVSVAINTVGMYSTLRIFGNMLRSALLPETLLRPGDAYIYSVVVDERLRGLGFGRAMLDQTEQIAYNHGARAVLLRVLSHNDIAHRLYDHAGYQVIGRTPRWIGWLSYSTDLMRKDLHHIR
jgi:ribosomal protein S18 acetylase RimI-like enzyme